MGYEFSLLLTYSLILFFPINITYDKGRVIILAFGTCQWRLILWAFEKMDDSSFHTLREVLKTNFVFLLPLFPLVSTNNIVAIENFPFSC